MAKISSKNIANAIYEATDGKSGVGLADAVKNSAKMLKDKRLLGKSEEILEILQNILDKKSGTVRVKITSAKSLKKEEKVKLEDEIKKKYGAKEVISQFFENINLLGGVRIEMKDEVTDTTYKNKLNQLEKFLIKE